MKHEQHTVEALLREFERAYAKKDLEAIGRIFAQDEDVVFYGTQANLHFVGWGALEDSLKKQFAAVESARFVHRDVRVRLLAGGAAACASALLDYDAVISGAPVTARGVRMTCSLERRVGGFRVVHMHWSVARGEVLVEH